MLDDPAERHQRWAGRFAGPALKAEVDDLAEALVDIRNTPVDRIYRSKSTSR